MSTERRPKSLNEFAQAISSLNWDVRNAIYIFGGKLGILTSIYLEDQELRLELKKLRDKAFDIHSNGSKAENYLDSARALIEEALDILLELQPEEGKTNVKAEDKG